MFGYRWIPVTVRSISAAAILTSLFVLPFARAQEEETPPDDAMAEAIEQSSAVIVCISPAYKRSANCRMEGKWLFFSCYYYYFVNSNVVVCLS